LGHMERALAASDLCGRPLRHACFLEAAFCSATSRGDAAKARTWLARAANLRKPVSKRGVEAAIAMAENRYQDAWREWNAALVFLEKRKLDSGLARCGKLLIMRYQTRCREMLDAAAEQALATDRLTGYWIAPTQAAKSSKIVVRGAKLGPVLDRQCREMSVGSKISPGAQRRNQITHRL
jgi:hypothetical protein